VRSYSEVQAEIEYVEGELQKLRQEAKEAQAREVVEARKQVAELMKKTGLTVDDILNPRTVDKTKLTVVKSTGEPRKQPEPQYKDPNSDKTWTGQGRCPKWMKDQDKEKFRIQKAA
jgi:DNA-binding protein H-NS